MKDVFSVPNFVRLRAIIIYGVIATIAFTLIYGLCNDAASKAEDYYHLYTQFELSIPLIPWMIYPYLSLNLLFVVAAFVLRSEKSIKAFCLSLSISAVLAGIVFYFFPGQLGFVREVPAGYEALYNGMFAIDHPHNLFPSLHVTYSSLSIWSMVEQTKSKVFHRILWIWLLVISFSVVLVHQHHLFDIFTGWILAYVVFEFFYKKIKPNNVSPVLFFI